MANAAMIDYFKTLGVNRRTLSIDRETLEERFHELQRSAHPDMHVSANAETREETLNLSSDINRAYRTLRDPLQRLKHLLALYGYSAETSKQVPQELLMAVMETQEKVSELEVTAQSPRKEQLIRELSPLAETFEHRLEALEDERDRLGDAWDTYTAHPETAEALSEEERSILSRLSSLLAERAYVETLRASIRAAQAGEPLILRH